MMSLKAPLIAVYIILLALSLAPTKGQVLINLSQLDSISTSNAYDIQHLSTIVTDTVGNVSFSHNGTLLAGGIGLSVKVWDVQTGNLIDEISRPRSDDALVTSLAFSPIKNLLAIGWSDGLSLWDIESDINSFLEQGDELYTIQVIFSPDGSLLAADCGYDVSICLWDVESLELITTFENQSRSITSGEPGLPVIALSINSENSLLAGATMEGMILIWSLTSTQLTAEIEAHNRDHSISDIIFTPDDRLITSSYLGIKVWDTDNWSEQISISEIYNASNLATNPDATILASSGSLSQQSMHDDDIVQLWELNTGEELVNLGGSQDRVEDIIFNTQGTLLAIGRLNNNIELWGILTSD
jgi:WD40 repeat protein